MTDGRSGDPIRPGDAWCSRSEREYFVTVIRAAARPGWWIVNDGGNEREASADELATGFVLDTPWT